MRAARVYGAVEGAARGRRAGGAAPQQRAALPRAAQQGQSSRRHALQQGERGVEGIEGWELEQGEEGVKGVEGIGGVGTGTGGRGGRRGW